MALIEAKGIKKIYESEGVETHALRGVTFSISKGEFVVIVKGK